VLIAVHIGVTATRKREWMKPQMREMESDGRCVPVGSFNLIESAQVKIW
jgi:hypothetical protein